jgi:hypothetical protein
MKRKNNVKWRRKGHWRNETYVRGKEQENVKFPRPKSLHKTNILTPSDPDLLQKTQNYHLPRTYSSSEMPNLFEQIAIVGFIRGQRV